MVSMLPGGFLTHLRWVLLWALAFSALLNAHGADALFVPDGLQRQSVADYLTILEDSSKSLSVEQVAAGKAGPFRRLEDVVPKNLTNGVYWGRLAIDLKAYKASHFYLLLDPTLVGRIDVFFRKEDGGFGSTVIDQDQRAVDENVPDSGLFFKIPSGQEEVRDLYIRFETRGHALQTAFSWVSSPGVLKEIAKDNLIQGLLFGGLIALVLYNAFLFFTTRDKSYLLYVYYLTSFTLVMGGLTGRMPPFPPFNSTTLQFVIFNCATINGGMWFFRQFMDLRAKLPRTDRFFQMLQWASVVLFIVALCGGMAIAYPVSLNLIILAEIGLVAGSIVRWRQGFEPAKYTACGVAGHAIVSIAYIFEFTRIIHVPYLTIYAVEMAALWEALFFSFALAYRVRLAEASANALIAQQEGYLAAEQRALLEAKQATKEKNTVLSMISHELRSPLQVLSSALQNEQRVSRGPEHDVFIKKAKHAVGQIESQLRDLFILSIGDSGKLEMRAEPFEVRELVESVLGTVSDTARAKGLDVAIEGPPEPLFVVADPKRVEQVLSNLVENAVKYTNAGQISVVFQMLDTAHLRFKVIDTGVGISEQNQSEMFTPYRRFGAVDRDRSSNGIGLAVVKTLLAHLGGSVSVESKLNLGTTITVTIPVTISEELDQERCPGDQLHLLIVDDRRDVLDALCSVASPLGYAVDTAESTVVASNKMAAHVYDIVLIDLDMPVKNGFELASETRRGQGPNADSRLIAISAGTAEFIDGFSGVKDLWPFDDFLPKPIDAASLKRAAELRPRSERLADGADPTST